MNTAIKKRCLIIPLLFVIILLLSFYGLISEVDKQQHSESKANVLLFSARNDGKSSVFDVFLINRLNADNYQKQHISTFSMPFNKQFSDINLHTAFTDWKWFNLIRMSGNKWRFVNPVGGMFFRFFDIDYSPENKKINISKCWENEENYYVDDFIMSPDESGNYFITHTGCFLDVNGKESESEKEKQFFEADKQENKKLGLHLLGRNACPLDENTMVFIKDCWGKKGYVLTKISIEQEENPTKDKKEVGIAQKMQHNSNRTCKSHAFSFETGTSLFFRPYHWFIPITASPDRKKIAFLVNDQLPANNNIQQNLLPEMNRYSQKSQCTWLVTWDVESNEVEKIAVMPQQDKIGIIPSTLLWSPATDCSLISLYTIEGVFIIDASRHIVKKILFKGDSDWPVSVIRWSPDGTQLGILKDNGTFYIYNIAEDTLTKVNREPDCFNFVWVE